MARAARRTVDLSGYPDLVVIYLGMRVNTLRGVGTLFGFGPKIRATLPHKEWWRNYVKDTSGTGFWHETYFMRGGIEAVYANMEKPLGLTAFAPVEPARGSMFSARKRLRLDEPEAEPVAAPYSESDLY